MIKLVLDSIRVSVKSEFKILIFREERAERYLPLWIGTYEVQLLLDKLENRAHEQIATFDYFSQFLKLSDLKIEKVYIHALVDDIYFAKIIATRRKFLTKETVEIDCRPSDGFLLSLYCGVPIFATPELMDKASIRKDEYEKEPPVTSTQPASPEIFDPYQDFWQNFISLE